MTKRLVYKFSHRRNSPVIEYVDNNPALNSKVKEALSGTPATTQWTLRELSTRAEDLELVADFILNWSNESEDGMPMRPNTKKVYVNALVYLCRYLDHKKSSKEMTKEDIIDGYLRSLKKGLEEDIDQRWVSTYNLRGSCYLAFWKWLTQRELPREQRQTPPQLKGWRSARRKTKTHVKREDYWTADEHRVFLNHCEDPRLACFHALARDTGARPGELLDLKISDLKIQTSPSTGKKFAEFTLGHKLGGKMKRPRSINISDSIPYLNVWTAVHPRRDLPQGAYLFASKENRSQYRNVPIKTDSVRQAYVKTIEEHFPKLLDKPDIPLEDKVALKSLIRDKPHYPYLFRHEFASEYAPRLPPMAFNQLMGHSPMSRMREVYVQELGNEGNKELMIARGIVTREDTYSQAQLELKPKYCPICREANKSSADFCFKCNWIISKKGMQEVRETDIKALEEAKKQKQDMQEVKQHMSGLEKMVAELMNQIHFPGGTGKMGGYAPEDFSKEAIQLDNDPEALNDHVVSESRSKVSIDDF